MRLREDCMLGIELKPENLKVLAAGTVVAAGQLLSAEYM
jgi:hypothetical protein